MKLEIPPILDLLHRSSVSTLATQSLQMPGYPYATVIPNVLDECHRPLLLVSALAEHTKNLLANAKVSLSFNESGVSNIQDAQRLTLVGDVEHFEPSELLVARYLRHVPAAEQYLALDFMFFRVIPKRVRYIGGVGKMGWLEADTLEAARRLDLREEADLLFAMQAPAPSNLTLLGIDPYGIDYCVDGFRERVSLGDGDFRDALSVAVELAGS